MTNPLLIADIGQLVTASGEAGAGESSLGVQIHQAVLIEDGLISRIGSMAESWVEEAIRGPAEVYSAAGRCVIPGFVDSHTHLIHGGDRVDEFVARMSGEPYTGQGIKTTVRATRIASDLELRESLRSRVDESLRQGTTTVEIKTGYGLDVDQERRLAVLAGEVTDQVTFLGAHLVPDEWAGDPEGYVDRVAGPMLDAVAPYVRFVDVFVEKGAFSVDQARRVLTAGISRGLRATLHASQLGPGAGASLAKQLDAVSLSHGTHLTESDLDELASSDTVVTLLPGTEFSTRAPYPDAKKIVNRGITVALATNCNPGSGYSSSMPFMIALAVREMGMTPADALWSATRGGARALRLTDRGMIAPGMRADLVILDAPHYAYLAYRPGVPLVSAVIRGGVVVTQP